MNNQLRQALENLHLDVMQIGCKKAYSAYSRVNRVAKESSDFWNDVETMRCVELGVEGPVNAEIAAVLWLLADLLEMDDKAEYYRAKYEKLTDVMLLEPLI